MLAAVALVVTACGSGGGAKTSNEAITVASFNFSESEILANMYADVLKKAGVSVTMKDKLGSREVVEPALQSGQVDLVPEYAGTALEFLNKNAGEASSNLDATVAKLRDRYKPLNITVLDPSPAADQNAFAVSKATADKYHLTKTSQVAPYASQWTLGGPPECPTRPFCQPGLTKTYGLNFKSFKSLDAGGPLTETAIANGQINMGLVFTSDGGVEAKGLVVLADDKHLQTVDNIVPVIRNAKDNSAVSSALNKVSAALTTDQLVTLNKMVDVDKADPSAVALSWLKSKGLA
ncbi:MAG TPA: ABC transporter substrate-binding protein [Acidimicrobiales bacterium]|jgi:osmoprotectant transport system substrate-binding protein